MPAPACADLTAAGASGRNTPRPNRGIPKAKGRARAAAREVREKVLTVWRMAPRYWCLADLLTFGLVPLRLRPMSNALLSIPWGMYISSVANQRR